MTPVPDSIAEGLQCKVCHNSDHRRFNVKYSRQNYSVVVCGNCNFHFIPQVFRKNISYENYKNAGVTAAVRAGNNWAKVQRHKLRFRFIEKFVKSGRLLDIGAGWGHFLLAGRELGYDVSGIEISEQQFLYCVDDLKLPVRHIDFFLLDEKEKFDVVTLWDVLEHIDDPGKFLEKCAAVTQPGGYLFLQVPQIDSYVARREKGNWKMIGLDHVNYFGKKTISRILADHGFDVVRIKSSFEIKLFIMYTLLPLLRKFRSSEKKDLRSTNEGINAAERQEYFNRFTGKPMWVLKVFVGIHNIIYNSLSFFRIGEEMMVAARKR